MDNLLGVVLCGGESKRMGSDKGLLRKGETSWAQYTGDKLAACQIPVVFSIHPKQLAAYSDFVPAELLITDALAVQGPLKGLLSVHAKSPSKDLLLLACDMLDLDDLTIRKIIAAYREDDQYDFYVYQGAQFAQPFCGIYTSGGLAREYTLALQDELRDFSLQSLLNRGKTKRLKIDRLEAFKNYNTL